MIYYKITDKESDLYKKLYEQRTMELEVHKQNQVILAKPTLSVGFHDTSDSSLRIPKRWT